MGESKIPVPLSMERESHKNGFCYCLIVQRLDTIGSCNWDVDVNVGWLSERKMKVKIKWVKSLISTKVTIG